MGLLTDRAPWPLARGLGREDPAHAQSPCWARDDHGVCVGGAGAGRPRAGAHCGACPSRFPRRDRAPVTAGWPPAPSSSSLELRLSPAPPSLHLFIAFVRTGPFRVVWSVRPALPRPRDPALCLVTAPWRRSERAGQQRVSRGLERGRPRGQPAGAGSAAAPGSLRHNPFARAPGKFPSLNDPAGYFATLLDFKCHRGKGSPAFREPIIKQGSLRLNSISAECIPGRLS